MQLGQLLASNIYHNAKVIVGDNGLSRNVQSVNIMDAPDIINYLKPEEFLLTNGYFIKDHPEAFIQLIEHMDRLNCPGIGVKSHRFSLEIPANVLEKATLLQFPIIELSGIPQSLGEILQLSTSLILDNKNDELRYALTIHKKFSTLVMHGQGIPEIIDSLAQSLLSPILLINSNNQIKGQSSHFDQLDRNLFLEDTMNAISRLSLRKPALLRSFQTEYLLPYRHLDVYPINTYRHEGYLVAFRENPPLNKSSALAIEQAANVIGMELTKQQALKERSRRYKNEFFSDLIDGYIVSEQEAMHMGKKYGLQLEKSYLLVVLRNDDLLGKDVREGQTQFEEKQISERDMQYDLIKHHFSLLDVPFVMFTRNDLFVMLVKVKETGWDEAAFIRYTEEISDQLYDNARLSISIGIGKLITHALDIGISYNEAMKALQFGYHMKKKRFVQSYQSNGIGHLLRLIPPDELTQFFEETFKCFSSLNAHESKELMRTLKVYYDNQCQLVETSKQLFVHRNTVVYRLEKCEKLSGVHLRDPMVSLQFRIAFALEPFIKSKINSSAAQIPSIP
ncbi:PucR family transcriptional regulator [Cohnella sp. WQ 127256]|uniref:PucR family transcriptional regulator n=1 Tax=Cohnella sp. WQ 127256 TaxID=2938790 RepID=UPI002118556B|nr:PucR family transcriptional regulator [Cohnella sp. WQ 127256]